MESGSWLGYADERVRGEVVASLVANGLGGEVSFCESPSRLRSLAATDESVRRVVVGHVERGVSDVNLAAAIVADRGVHEVVLVRDKASGSLRSRAQRAGISLVIDSSDVAFVPGEEEPNVLDGGPTPAEDSSPAGGLRGVLPGVAVPPEETTVGNAEPRNGASSGEGLVQEPRPGLGPEPKPGLGQEPAQDSNPEPMPKPLRSIASHPERVRADGAPVIVLCSGRGGSGKSTIAVAAAASAASWGMRVGLVDLDLSCGNARAILGVPRGGDLSSMAKARDGSVTIPKGTPVGKHMRVWGPCERPENAELAMPFASELISQVARQCDLVLVDTSTTFTDAVAQAAQMCDRLAIVGDHRPGSMAAVTRMAGLAVRLGVARTRIVRIENCADPRTKANLSLGRADVGLETARVYRVFDGQEDVPELASLGKGEALAGLGTEFSESVAHFVATLLSEVGRLPDVPEAQQALKVDGSRHGWGIFGRKREVG